MMKLTMFLCVLLAVAAVQGYLLNNRNPFQYPCPDHCMDGTCTRMGCVRCSPDYCRYYNARHQMAICVATCPEGYGCYRGIQNHCTSCNIRNCMECTIHPIRGRTLCDRCKTRYTVSRDKRRCTRSRRY